MRTGIGDGGRREGGRGGEVGGRKGQVPFVLISVHYDEIVRR